MQQQLAQTIKPIRQVMLIDDDNMDNFLHTRVLKNSGWVQQVYAFEHAEDALAFFRSDARQIDVIFVDINMPRMDGYAFLDAFEELQQAQEFNPLIIVLSTSISPEDIRRAGAYSARVRTEQKPLCIDKLERLLIDDFDLSVGQGTKQ